MSFGRLERTHVPAPMNDINMTPLIDVMLVLLVIFIISAPLMNSSLKLDLPQTNAAKPSEASQFISVSISPNGQIYLGAQAISANAFAQEMKQTAQKNPATEVQLRADKNVPYGQVVQLIGLVQKSGLNRIGFVAQTEGDF